jgi:hypothetical protein
MKQVGSEYEDVANVGASSAQVNILVIIIFIIVIIYFLIFHTIMYTLNM